MDIIFVITFGIHWVHYHKQMSFLSDQPKVYYSLPTLFSLFPFSQEKKNCHLLLKTISENLLFAGCYYSVVNNWITFIILSIWLDRIYILILHLNISLLLFTSSPTWYAIKLTHQICLWLNQLDFVYTLTNDLENFINDMFQKRNNNFNRTKMIELSLLLLIPMNWWLKSYPKNLQVNPQSLSALYLFGMVV